jgi:uncharacterized protein YdiU (UPF0061 family)
MHALGVPTTRAGAVITSDSMIVRDQFYDGNPRRERCSVVLRIAPTFLRFGSFEVWLPSDPVTRRSGPSPNNTELLRTLATYARDSFFAGASFEAMYHEVVRRTARLVAQWQLVGFCHGVLNTDNMSLVGVTLDYGPFGFLDRYDENHIPNSSDEHGRYAFGNQPGICRWNCAKLGEALTPVLADAPAAIAAARALFDEEF